MITAELTNTALKLIETLDRDIAHLNSTLGHLDKLRTFVIKRDDRSMDELLTIIRKEVDAYKCIEKQRHVLAQRLSKLLAIGNAQFNLTMLSEHLPCEISQQLEEKIESLSFFMTRLRKEHAATVTLIADCARLNSMLLNAIFGPARPTVGYGRSGSIKRMDQAAFMNLNF